MVVAFADAAAAEVARRALLADDPGSVQVRTEGSSLVVEAGPAGVGSLVVTVEDVFRCLVAASGALAAVEDGSP